MFPSMRNWRNYSALEKATYIAALFGVISLPLSAYFWYQNRSDADDSYRETQQLFIETNRPIVELDKIQIEFLQSESDGVVRFFLKNSGNFKAKNVCIAIAEPFGRDGAPMPPPNNFVQTMGNTCGDKNNLPRVALRKHGETSIPLIELSEIQRRIGFIPNTASIQRGQPYQNLFLFFVSYEDDSGEKYKDMFPFEFYGSKL